jgi:hypothetical protein
MEAPGWSQLEFLVQRKKTPRQARTHLALDLVRNVVDLLVGEGVGEELVTWQFESIA